MKKATTTDLTTDATKLANGNTMTIAATEEKREDSISLATKKDITTDIATDTTTADMTPTRKSDFFPRLSQCAPVTISQTALFPHKMGKLHFSLSYFNRLDVKYSLLLS